jgi:hypothetical protein
MSACITCGEQLPAERADKYDYCTRPECQERNAKALTIMAVGVNKSADQFQILDERSREELASGKYHDQRRATFGTDAAARTQRAPDPPPTVRAARAATPPPRPVRPRWSRSQERLAVIYNQQGLRPEEIARRLGVSTYLATQMILAGRNRRKR